MATTAVAPTPTAEAVATTGVATTTASAAATPTGTAGPTATTGARATVATAAAVTTRGTTTTRGSATVAGSPPPAPAGGQAYRDPQGRFSFTIPGNWTQVQPAGATVAFQSPAPTGTAPATCNVVLEDVPGGVTLDEYDQAGEAELRRQFPDYRAIGLDRLTVDGRQAYKRAYTATIASLLTQLQQTYLIDRNVAYIITCGAPQQSFATYAPTFDQITGTFRIGTP